VNIRTTFQLLAALLLSLATAHAADQQTWREEAVQHDGTVLIVERTVTFRGVHEVGQPPPVGDQTIRFTLPQSQRTVEWTDPFSPELGMANFQPMLVEARGDTAYIVAYPMGCLSYNKWGRPNPSYVVFQYRAGQWDRIPLSELPSDIQYPNIVLSGAADQARRAPGGVIPASTIRKLYTGYWPEYLQRIFREPVAQPQGGACLEMFEVGKGRWLGTDTFRAQPDRASCERVCTLSIVSPAYCPCSRFFPTEK
jgi:hypothetical protein